MMQYWPTAVVTAALAAGGCDTERSDSRPVAPTRTAEESAPADAEKLGREIYRLLDRAADYRGAHRGQAPRFLRDLGIDSLTPELARVIRGSGAEATATVSFRNTAGHGYTSCSGDLNMLESAVLADGRYELRCTTPAGEERTVQAGGALE